MIDKLILENFKAFEKLTLSLGTVNLLTGLNGMGKSTVLQALLLLKQSFSSPANQQFLLNGDYIQLGWGKDVLYENATEDEIGIFIASGGEMYNIKMRYDADSDRLAALGIEPMLDCLRQILEHVYYLSAARITPQYSYAITNGQTVGRRDFGRDGVYALQYLFEHGSSKLKRTDLVLGEDSQNSLLRQASLWMNYITPGTNIEVLMNRALQSAELNYSFREGDYMSNAYRSINVGFGLTYVLPIIVQLLTAEPGDILLIENPEAHIHPAGQSRLGELVSRTGAGGVQVIVETHSDHFLNGVRLAVKRGRISPEVVRLFYFSKDEADGFKHTVRTPMIHSDGQLDQWPKGFMDEWENMLLELLQ